MIDGEILYGIGEYRVDPNSPGNLSKAVGEVYSSACNALGRIKVTAFSLTLIQSAEKDNHFNTIEAGEKNMRRIVEDWKIFDVFARTLPSEIVEPVYTNETLRALLEQAGVKLRS